MIVTKRTLHALYELYMEQILNNEEYMDPIPALAAATTAFNAIKKGFSVGRDVESMSKDLGRWMGAIQDVKDGHKKSKGRSFGSVEEEALETFAAKKKAEQMEWDLRNFVEYLPNIIPLEDSDISKELEKSFKKKGIKIMTSSEVMSVEKTKNNVIALVKNNGEEIKIESEILLSAVGIKSNIENIGLEEVGIATDKDKILVDKYYSTNIPGYYAIGDVVAGPALAHVASAEGILCVEKIAGHDVNPLDYNNIPGCTYCSPEIASVGYTEEQAIEIIEKKLKTGEINLNRMEFFACDEMASKFAVMALQGYTSLHRRQGVFDSGITCTARIWVPSTCMSTTTTHAP